MTQNFYISSIKLNDSYIDDLDEDMSFGPQLKSSYGGKSLHQQSHGESFLATIQNRFNGDGLYILDEPEAALSPTKLLTLLTEIKYLTDKNSQFIISTHSPILMTYPNAKIYEINSDTISSVNYSDTEHYQITKSFLDNPERMLKFYFNENITHKTGGDYSDFIKRIFRKSLQKTFNPLLEE